MTRQDIIDRAGEPIPVYWHRSDGSTIPAEVPRIRRATAHHPPRILIRADAPESLLPCERYVDPRNLTLQDECP